MGQLFTNNWFLLVRDCYGPYHMWRGSRLEVGVASMNRKPTSLPREAVVRHVRDHGDDSVNGLFRLKRRMQDVTAGTHARRQKHPFANLPFIECHRYQNEETPFVALMTADSKIKSRE